MHPDARPGPAGRPGGGEPGPGEENRVLRELVAVYRHLSGLALQDADVATVARLIAERTGATVAVVGPTMDIIAAAAPGSAAELAAADIREHVVHPRLGRVLDAAGSTRRALRLPGVGGGAPVIVAPILVGDDVPAYLLTLDGGRRGHGEDISLLLTEHAATICGVILGRERVVAAAAGRVRHDLVEGLLSSRWQEDGEVERWARHLGYDQRRDHHVLSVAVDPPGEAPGEAPGEPPGGGEGVAAPRQRTLAAVEHFFTTRVPEAITAVRESEVVVVLPEPAGPPPAPNAAQLGSLCLSRVGELLPDAVLTIGIGGACRRPADVARSYAEARRTIDMLRRMGRRGCVVAFDALDIHRLLLQVPDLAELRGFAAAVLGKLTAYEREHGSDFLPTLACYFRENNSPQRAAKHLHVHPNTVTYRIRRVEEITGLDLDSYRDRLLAQVALEILDAVGDGL